MGDAYLQQLKRGTFEMIFLSLLSKKPMYGGEIMAILNTEGSPYFSGASEGSVYPVFYRLEDAGYIKSVPNGNQKKDFHITESGLQKLYEMKSRWNGFTSKVNFFLDYIVEEEQQ